MKGNVFAMLKNMEMVPTVMLIAILFALSGCSKSPVSCDSGKATTAVINSVSQDLKKDLSVIAGMGGTGMELSDDEWKALRAGIVIDLENIRENSFDEAAGKRICAANLMIVQSGKKEIIPITYASEIRKDTGEQKVTFSGLKEYKQAQKPLSLPQ